MLIIDTFLLHVSVNACVVAAWCTAFLGGILLFHSIVVAFFFVLSILQRVDVACVVIFYMVMSFIVIKEVNINNWPGLIIPV